MSRALALTVTLVLLGGSAGAGPPLRPGVHRGVNHAHVHARGHGYGSDASARELRALRELGVDSVVLTPFAYQRKATSSRLAGSWTKGLLRFSDPTLTDEDLAAEIRRAKELGFRVVLKPHVWSSDFWSGDEWHGTIRQRTAREHAAWWAAYRSMTLHYSRIGLEAGADAVCLGTELVRLSTAHPEEWRALAADVRRLAPETSEPPELTYAAHWAEEAEAIRFWDALDWVGVSAYHPLAVGAGAGEEELVAAWEPHREGLRRLAERWERPLVFLEAGYRPVGQAWREPWRYDGGDPDEGAQRLAYEALFRALGDEPWWGGVYWWKTFTSPGRATQRGDGADYSFRGRPAEAVVRRWFAPVPPGHPGR